MGAEAQKPPGPSSSVDGGARLELVDLSKRYGEVVALEQASLALEPGRMHGFVGRNGAGKTTAMRIAIGVLAPDSGQVLWNGHPARDRDRRAIGYMPEERGLYPKMRVAEQLTYLAQIHGRDRELATKRAKYWLQRLEIERHATDPVESLSLGNQQRVQLAASLVIDPELLILDEPFSGLDPIGTDILSEVLLEICRQGIAVLFSSHQLELVERLCDEVTIIRSGRVVGTGDVQDLRESASQGLWRMRTDPPLAATVLPNGIEEVRTGVYRATSESDSQALLDAGRRHGRVLEFARVQVSLAELFRESVGDEVIR